MYEVYNVSIVSSCYLTTCRMSSVDFSLSEHCVIERTFNKNRDGYLWWISAVTVLTFLQLNSLVLSNLSNSKFSICTIFF